MERSPETRAKISAASRERCGELSSAWTGDNATYLAKHKRVYRARGKAKDYKCSHCSRQASCWATIHGTDGLDVWNDYMPLCASCHNLYDDIGHKVSTAEVISRRVETRRQRRQATS